MALKFKGNLEFKLQVGASGPTPDEAYGIYRRMETWQGKESDLAIWLLSKPDGSPHPTWPWLKLSVINTNYLPAGMVDAQLNYVGHPNGETAHTDATSNASRSIEESGNILAKARVAYNLWSDKIHLYPSIVFDANLYAPASRATTIYVPSVTYRYGSPFKLKQPTYKTLALLNLNGGNTTIISQNVTRVGLYKTDGGIYNTSSAAALATLGWLEPQGNTNLVKDVIGSINSTKFQAGELGVNNTLTGDIDETVNLTNLTCNPIGRSGWYEVEETWEANSAINL
tara:strand:+ start:6419 stop:7270 length:852 start_codon:yes stop_codon:yes gene_type:complete